jgi:hypothetical protein
VYQGRKFGAYTFVINDVSPVHPVLLKSYIVNHNQEPLEENA